MNTKLRWLVPWTVLACALAAALAGGVGASSPASAQPDAVYGTPSAPDKLTPQLRQRVDRADPATLLPAIVVMAAQADVSAPRTVGRRDRLRRAENRLRATADSTQGDLLRDLAVERSRGNVSHVVPLWIQNAVSLRATPDVLTEISRRPDVASVQSDVTIAAPEPSLAQAAGPAAEPNISVVNAPAMWDLGFRGQGVVVASMDTGVDVTHPELASGWRGGSDSWYDPNGQHPTTPTDVSGHGTQTMSVIVGGAAAGTAIGVAPAARWIAVKIFNDRGTTTSTAIHLGFQWLLDPDHDPATADAPNVVNNSWTLTGGGCVLDFQQDLRNLRAVGILPVFAAGNFGPTAGTVPSPANNPEALSVGGTDDTDVVDPSSSRGPSGCAGASSPTLTAPDKGIRTADLFGSYVDDTGTSVAAPHVTGAIALLLSARPGLAASADLQQAALQQGAHDLGLPGVDNDTGFGRLDALAAYLQSGSIDDFTVGVAPSSAGTTPGGQVSYDVTVASVGSFAADVSLSATGLPAGAAAAIDPSTVTGGAGTARLTVSTDGSLAPGTYPFTVVGTSGSLTHSTGATLVVSPPPDFSIAVTPTSRTVNPGAGTSYAVTVGSLYGFGATVDLSVSGVPAGVGSAQLSPASVQGSGSSTLTVTTLPTAPAGSYPITITGTSGARSHTASATLVVQKRDFVITAHPTTASVSRGGSATVTVSVTGTGGFTGTVALAVSGVPSSAYVTWSSTKVTVPGTSKLTVRTTVFTTRRSYTLTITGTSGTLKHSVPVTLKVT